MIGQTYEITCGLKKANGRWKVLGHVAGGTLIFMGRMGRNGELLGARKENMLTLDRSVFDRMIKEGTAKMDSGQPEAPAGAVLGTSLDEISEIPLPA